MQRRLYTAGTSKSRLDPFLPEKPEDVEWLRGLQDELHEMFRDWVLTRRGDRLGVGRRAVHGEVWTGARAAGDWAWSTGSARRAACSTERFPDAELVPVEARRPLLARLGIGPAPAAAARSEPILCCGIAQAAEIRATWARYGL